MSRATLVGLLVFSLSAGEGRFQRQFTIRLNACHVPGNKFERFRVFLVLISRFEFEFCRCVNFFFEEFEFLVCSCECAVACLCPRNSISNVVASVTIHDDI